MKKKKTPMVFLILSFVFLCVSAGLFFAYIKHPHLMEYATSKLYGSIVFLLLSIVLLVVDRTIRLMQIKDTMDEINGKINNKEL